jgi:hypothetical protein
MLTENKTLKDSKELLDELHHHISAINEISLKLSHQSVKISFQQSFSPGPDRNELRATIWASPVSKESLIFPSSTE